ncbi:DUF1295 domain-containing protein [Nocardia yunnanensis]|uniref:DUF1295 domain-containing protein n=1 Tax=Nocardia yunnanensis TaxID=2382165 RepID=A0A386ZEA4_9NOCA|nr:DUF1295 domain-containing protein [Nocardia yunnanensis]AYF75860.1 DUF1295 domain-containing protein [Nocardia yunnanensis]
MNWPAELRIWLLSAAVLILLQAVTYLIGRRIGRYNVVDVIWGPGFVLVAAVGLAFGDGAPWRRTVLFALVAIWGTRLGWHLARRTAGHGEDPRYDALLDRHGRSAPTVITRIFLTQAVAQWVISLPIQVSAAAGDTRGPGWVLVAAGVLVWAIGVCFEALGDRQLARFKADPAHRGRIMDEGLWAWTRHPNYFGDFCVWWGLWLIAASAWPGLLTGFAPMIMSYLLIRGTGARMLERAMRDRPGYADYQARTAYFFPRPPR